MLRAMLRVFSRADGRTQPCADDDRQDAQLAASNHEVLPNTHWELSPPRRKGMGLQRTFSSAIPGQKRT
jgi:hypothetical protein